VEPYAAIWIAGGKIWRASATAGGTPSAAQVSSEANVGDPSVPGKRVAAIQTPATGALSGWLVLGTSFVRTDPSFANPVVVLAGVGAAALVAGTPSQMLLRVHSSGTVRVQRFDSLVRVTNTASVSESLP